jgi:hypothetical protein
MLYLISELAEETAGLPQVSWCCSTATGCSTVCWQLTMLSAALLRGLANFRMYGWEAFTSMESLAKPSTQTAGRLLAVTTCLLYTAAGEPGKRQHGR